MANYYDKFVEKAGDVTVVDALSRSNGLAVSHFQACASIGFEVELQSNKEHIIDSDFNGDDAKELFVSDGMSEEEALSKVLDAVGMTSDQALEMKALMKTVGDGDMASVLSQFTTSYQAETLTAVGSVNSAMGRGIARQFFQSSNLIDNENYQSWENERQANFLESIVESDEVTRLRNKWDSGEISDEEKHVLAEEVHKLHAQAYGYETVEVMPKSLDDPSLNDASAEELRSQTDHATFYDDKIVYNDVNDMVAYSASSATQFVDTMAHESQHAFQSSLIKRLEAHDYIEYEVAYGVDDIGDVTSSGYKDYADKLLPALKNDLSGGWTPIDEELLVGGALREAAQLFTISDNNYIDGNVDLLGYMLTHQERDAWDTGYTVTKYLESSPEEQSQMLSDIRSEYSDHEVENVMTQYTDEELNMTCHELADTMKLN